MLQTGHLHPVAALNQVLDLHDGRDRSAQVRAKELHTYGAHMLGHAMQNEAGRGNEAVAPLLLHPGQSAQKLVRYILAQPLLAKDAAGHLQDLRLGDCLLSIPIKSTDPKTHQFLVMNLSEVVIKPLHLQPVAVRHDHTPGCQVIQGGSPEYRLFTPGIHGDIAADGAGILRCGVHRKG